MTTPAPLASPGGAADVAGVLGTAELHETAIAAGLAVTASASWPETDADAEVAPLAGFIESAFSPLIAEVAGRALRRRALTFVDLDALDPASVNSDGPDRSATDGAVPDVAAEEGTVTAIVLVTALGDVTSAARVAAAVDAGKRVAPLLFFQSVPNAVAGYLAARWHLTGPVVCVSGTTAGVEAAALLLDDGDADEALIASVDLGVTGGAGDRAAAILVTGPTGRPGIDPRERDEHPRHRPH
jgi:hypothetical protein